jgi:hypothetical protein
MPRFVVALDQVFVDSLGDSSDLPDPAILAAVIIEGLQAALDPFAQIAAGLAAPDGG